MLKTGCIFHNHTGTRISVMSRHTLSDGKTEDSRLVGAWDIWVPELGPDQKMVGAWYRNEITWGYFISRYKERLSSDKCTLLMKQVYELSLLEDLTLLCVEEDSSKCHRSTLLSLIYGICL